MYYKRGLHYLVQLPLAMRCSFISNIYIYDTRVESFSILFYGDCYKYAKLIFAFLHSLLRIVAFYSSTWSQKTTHARRMISLKVSPTTYHEHMARRM